MQTSGVFQKFPKSSRLNGQNCVDHGAPAQHLTQMSVQSASLPSELVAALAKVGASLQASGDIEPSLSRALDLLADLDPGHVARADGEIAAVASLYRQPPQSRLSRMFSPRRSAGAQLLETPGLEYLFIFHRDGRIREAALLKITGGLPSPFLFAAILWRLNDWAEPVRQAARRCAQRSFAQTDPGVIARTAAELLVRQYTWRRWQDERSVLDDVFGRSDVAEELAKLMSVATTGPQASILRYSLRAPVLDQHLEQLASEAVQPSVRAVALAALIERKVYWPSGSVWRWIDKPMGLRRRQTIFDHRDLEIAPPVRMLIERGLRDKSAVVRRVALNGIMAHMLGTADARALAAPFESDRSSSVREKAAYILRRENA